MTSTERNRYLLIGASLTTICFTFVIILVVISKFI
jgi:hypothetical protein